MKFKRLFVVLLISFMLLSVPCAYASDSNTDENINTNIQGVKINPVATAAIVGFNSVINSDSPTKPITRTVELEMIETCESKLDKIAIYLDNDNVTSYHHTIYKNARKLLEIAKRELARNSPNRARDTIAVVELGINKLNMKFKL